MADASTRPLQSLVSLIEGNEYLEKCVRSLQGDIDIPVSKGIVPFLFARMVQVKDGMLVVVVPTGREAQQLFDSLACILPREYLDIFPSWETLPHERLSPRFDTVAQRLLVLRRLACPQDFPPLKILIMPMRSFIQPIVHGLGKQKSITLIEGHSYDMEEVEKDLVLSAYSRVDMVEKRGDFAVRGGILDIFPPHLPHPVRIDFFGDEIEEIHYFSIADQRSSEERVEKVHIPPCREILLTDDVRQRARMAIETFPGAADILEKIADGISVDGMESLAPILVERMETIDEVIPRNSRVCIVEPERCEQRSQSLQETTEEFLAAAWSAAVSGGKIPVDVRTASFVSYDQMINRVDNKNMQVVRIAGISDLMRGEKKSHVHPSPKFHGSNEKLQEFLREHVKEGWVCVVVFSGKGPASRFERQFMEEGIPARLVEEMPSSFESSLVYLVVASVHEGFVSENEKFMLLTPEDITGKSVSSANGRVRMPRRRSRSSVDPLTLTPGDFIVHDRHGVGRFVRMDKRKVNNSNAEREYLVVEYASTKRGGAGDLLWVPTDQLDLISKYSGGEAPTLNKMGGADWAKTKSKARAATKEIASELLRLYATRLATKGHAFSADTPWQRELEDSFDFVETPDQLQTIDEVKADMERPVPMDRLISGDVGYGKTEIAVRAAFKAVQDSKQVAILVPTTLLVSQHYETFANRFGGFPVKIAQLSRFQSSSQSRGVIEGLREGTVDVVIGTHRLLTGDIRFKDLGLVVIDEEQRFGVEHKETLKQLYPHVDVLSMSATPIPRTLEMAVTGVREMSTLATPPEERHPVLTYVGRYEEKQMLAAINRELLRDGQVFYVHNRVSDLPSIADKLSSLIPQARIGVAHGKMSESALEEIIQKFWEKEIDVLVCTTIVETGLDISNANTLIVDDAHIFGLSQLHQLRGRVGRGRERAYAYFFYDAQRVHTQTALERLRTIASHTDLGSGIEVARRDLEIRGAGNMLGGQQSGHIAGVGFDLYVRMVAESVAKFRGKSEDEESRKEVRIELPVRAFLPESYIPSERLRLEMYQKIAGAKTEDECTEIRNELRDRYGDIPVEVERLFAINSLRQLCVAAGLEEVTVMGSNVRFFPVHLSDARQARLKRLYRSARLKPAVRTLLIPLPSDSRLGTSRSSSSENKQVLEWVTQVISSVFVASVGQ
ncbi:MAG: transcription-repair coupling factor [Actinomycetaceae bacterium]|nr:transcription-repair coupling factor [Actinomycetaceae bacterium]